MQASARIDLQDSKHTGKFLPNSNLRPDMKPRPGSDFDSAAYFLSLSKCSWDSQPVGVCLDAVRTLLATWVVRQEDNIDQERWNPTLPTEEIRFDRASYASDLSVDTMWEMVHFLQRTAAADEASGKELPASAAMIMLLICSYPATRFTSTDEDHPEHMPRDSEEIKNVKFAKLTPMFAPQNLSVAIRFDNSPYQAWIRIIVPQDEMRFQWEDWINSGMGVLKARRAYARTKPYFSLEWRPGAMHDLKPADLSRKMHIFDEPDEKYPRMSRQIDIHLEGLAGV